MTLHLTSASPYLVQASCVIMSCWWICSVSHFNLTFQLFDNNIDSFIFEDVVGLLFQKHDNISTEYSIPQPDKNDVKHHNNSTNSLVFWKDCLLTPQEPLGIEFETPLKQGICKLGSSPLHLVPKPNCK